jgi:hypothetical protein
LVNSSGVNQCAPPRIERGPPGSSGTDRSKSRRSLCTVTPSRRVTWSAVAERTARTRGLRPVWTTVSLATAL